MRERRGSDVSDIFLSPEAYKATQVGGHIDAYQGVKPLGYGKGAQNVCVFRYNMKPMAKILGYVDSAQDPVDWPTSPALGIKTLLENLKLKVDDVASYEINEAFAVVILANAKILGLDLAKVILLHY